jgi:hypothetical protein
MIHLRYWINAMILVALFRGVPLIAGSVPSTLHDPFDALLKKHVRDGVVDYRGLKSDERLLDGYLDHLGSADPESLGRDGRLTFWINAYNAFTLKLILNRYPGIESIKEIPRGDRWKARIWSVNGQKHSLDEIEHDILRKMNEPRIHFAIVCASFSCPNLRSEAYTAERLDEQLASSARDFLSDPEKGLRYGEERGLIWGTKYVLRISAIFDWFEEDFEATAGSVLDFILDYAPDGAAQFIRAHRNEMKVEHLDYDWSLNGA